MALTEIVPDSFKAYTVRCTAAGLGLGGDNTPPMAKTTNDEQLGDNPLGWKKRFEVIAMTQTGSYSPNFLNWARPNPVVWPPEVNPISQPRSAPFFHRKRAFGAVPNDREFLAEHYV